MVPGVSVHDYLDLLLGAYGGTVHQGGSMWKRSVLVMVARKQREREAGLGSQYPIRAHPPYSNFPSARPHLLKAPLLPIAPRVEDQL